MSQREWAFSRHARVWTCRYSPLGVAFARFVGILLGKGPRFVPRRPRDRTGGGDKGGGGGRSWVFRDWIDFLGIFGSLFFSRFLRTGMTTSTSSSLNSSQDSSGSDHPSSVADPLPTGDFQSQASQKSLLFPPIWKFQTPECGLKKTHHAPAPVIRAYHIFSHNINKPAFKK